MIVYRRALARAGFVTAIAVTSTLTFAAAAASHVTIQPDNAVAGSWSKITVRVPNESDTAGTTQVRLNLPTDTSFASVLVQPHPGWTAKLTTKQLPEPVETGDYTLEEAVTSITWKAEPGVRIAPDQFDEFAVSVGPLPEPGTYTFPAVQTYDDGTVVAWDMDSPDGGDEPAHPAPELVVEAADEQANQTGDHHHGHHDVHQTTSSDDSDTLARGAGIGGIVVGAAGLGIAALALRRRHG
jgi:uncharacterized protein YcnI